MGFDHGSNRDVDTTAEQLSTTVLVTRNLRNGITIKADASNAGIVYVGNSDVTAGNAAATDGFPLSAGNEVTIHVARLADIYVIASQANQVVYWKAD
jgi:hypothetical protein